ncbi:MAG: hypothetical protein [Cressdnaviricota sp.]|nr:MAG: hypothetical protein [Cressdnaviricota sp.]
MTAQQNNAKLHITVSSICCAKIKNASPPVSPRTKEATKAAFCSYGRRSGGSKDSGSGEGFSSPSPGCANASTSTDESDGYQ